MPPKKKRVVSSEEHEITDKSATSKAQNKRTKQTNVPGKQSSTHNNKQSNKQQQASKDSQVPAEGIKKRKVGRPRKVKKDVLDLVVDSDEDIPQTSSILKRKNRLNDILSSQQPSSQPSSQKRDEEDDGFVYKIRRKNGVMTPNQVLHHELQDLNESDGADMLDLEMPRRSLALDMPRRTLPDSSLQLSSPIRTKEDLSSIRIQDRDHLAGESSVREYRRRSSYFNRGKRISSISNGLPHPDVPVSDYYKLLDASHPEPDRMRQLLVWCLKKKMENDESERTLSSVENQTVHNIAKVIKEEVLHDLMQKRISASWYSSVPTDDDMGKEVVVPNPRNLENLDNIKKYTEKLKEIVLAKQQWQEAHRKAIEPIKNISNEVPVSTDKYEGVLDSSLVSQIEATGKLIVEEAAKVEPAVERLYHATYQLRKTADLVDQVHRTDVQGKLQVLLKEYMVKGKSWDNALSRDLLRSLSRVEHGIN